MEFSEMVTGNQSKLQQEFGQKICVELELWKLQYRIERSVLELKQVLEPAAKLSSV